jgi:hypothetical protein
MRASLVLLTTTIVAVAAASMTLRLAAAAEPAGARSQQATPRTVVQYAHVKSIRRSNGRFIMRVDPALWLSGVTAYRAAVEDKQLPPGEPVPNDYYIRDLEHRLLTYLVPANAHVTVLTRNGNGPIPTTTIDVAELAQIVQGKNPKHRRLLEPKAGFWLRVVIDRAVSIDQQYQP